MWLLKVRIRLYDERELISFTAVTYVSGPAWIVFIDCDNEPYRFLHSTIYKLKIVAFKSIKQTGE